MDYAASILARLPNRKRSIGLDGLVKKIQGYLPDEQVALVLDAYHYAEEAHRGGRTGIYDVIVINQADDKIAIFRGRSYSTSQPLVETH